MQLYTAWSRKEKEKEKEEEEEKGEKEDLLASDRAFAEGLSRSDNHFTVLMGYGSTGADKALARKRRH